MNGVMNRLDITKYVKDWKRNIQRKREEECVGDEE